MSLNNINNILNKYNILLINYNKFFFLNVINYKNNNLSKIIYLKGLNLIENIFNMSYLYLDNLGDIYNLCEKSYIYFIEFINQISISNIMENNIELTIKDAIIFCYKKTILNFENEIINKGNHNIKILNIITKVINILNKLNFIYLLEIHDKFDLKKNDESNNDEYNSILNEKLFYITKNISNHFKKICNILEKKTNDEINNDKDKIDNLLKFINHIFDLLKYSKDINFNLINLVIDKYINNEIYNNPTFDKDLLYNFIKENNIVNIDKLFTC